MPFGAAVAAVEAVFRLRDEISPQLATLEANMQATGKRWQKIGDDIARTGDKLTTSVTLPIVGAGAAAFKFSTDFNAAMANVGSLIPGHTERLADLKREVQDLAIETGTPTTGLAGGLYEVVSAFGDSADAARILEINARAAKGGVSTVREAVALTSVVTKNYGDTSAEAVQKVSDLALMTVRLGQTNFPQLASSMGRVTPLAQSLGQTQEELFAVFATGTGVTGTAAEVATQYRGILAGLQDPTESLTELIEKQGFASGEAMLEQKGLVGTLQDIVAAAEASGKPITDYVSSIEAVPLALALAGPQADTFQEKLAQLVAAAGATDDAFREQTEGINEAGHIWAQFQQRLTVFLQTAGDKLAPTLIDVVDAGQPLIDFAIAGVHWFGLLPQPIQTTAIGLLGVAAAVGPLLSLTGRWVSTTGSAIQMLGRLVGRLGNVETKADSVAAGAGRLNTVLGKAGLVAAAYAAGRAVGKLILRMAEWAHESDNVIARMLRASQVTSVFIDALRPEGLADWLDSLGVYGEKLDVVTVSAEEASGTHKVLGVTFNTLRGAIEPLPPIIEDVADGLGDVEDKATSVEKAMEALGVTTEADVLKSLEQLELLAASGSITLEQQQAIVDRWREEWAAAGLLLPEIAARLDDLETGIPSVTDVLSQSAAMLDEWAASAARAEMSGQSFGDLLESVGGEIEFVGTSVEAGAKSFEKFKESQGFFGKLGDIFSTSEGGLFDPGNISGMFSGLLGGQGIKGTLSRVVDQIGSMIGGAIAGPIGSAIGGALSKIGSAIGKLFGIGKKATVGEHLQEQFGLTISESLESQIQQLADELGDIDAAIKASLADIISEKGVADTADLQKFAQMSKETISSFHLGHLTAKQTVDAMIESEIELLKASVDLGAGLTTALEPTVALLGEVQAGNISAAEGARFLEGVFPDVAAAAREFGEEGQAALRSVIEQSRALGLEVDAIDEHVAQASSRVLSGVDRMISAGITSQQQAELAGRGLVVAYRELRKQGIPVTEIVEQIGDRAATLRTRFQELGVDGTKGLGEINHLTALLAKEGIPEMVERAQAAGEIFAGLQDLGLGGQTAFNKMAATVRQSYDELIAGGATARQAIALLGPELQQIEDAAAANNLEIDAGTQKLLDQAEAQGAVKGAAADAATVMQQGLSGVLERFDALLATMGVSTDGFFRFETDATGSLQGVAAEAAVTATTVQTEFETATSEAESAAVSLKDKAIEQIQAIGGSASTTAGDIASLFDRDFTLGVKFDVGKLNLPEGRGPLQFEHGTRGRFLDFGAGTLAMLHGRERIVTEDEARGGGGVATARPIEVHATIEMDGRKVGQTVLEVTPDLLRKAGL